MNFLGLWSFFARRISLLQPNCAKNWRQWDSVSSPWETCAKCWIPIRRYSSRAQHMSSWILTQPCFWTGSSQQPTKLGVKMAGNNSVPAVVFRAFDIFLRIQIRISVALNNRPVSYGTGTSFFSGFQKCQKYLHFLLTLGRYILYLNLTIKSEFTKFEFCNYTVFN